MIYTVERLIDGKSFLRDEDRITADSWDDAEMELVKGIASGKYDDSCHIDGRLLYEELTTEDLILDTLNNEKTKQLEQSI